MSNIRELLEQAEDWFDTYTVLEEAKEEDIPVLASMLPQFLKHREFLVRVSIVNREAYEPKESKSRI